MVKIRTTLNKVASIGLFVMLPIALAMAWYDIEALRMLALILMVFTLLQEIYSIFLERVLLESVRVLKSILRELDKWKHPKKKQQDSKPGKKPAKKKS